MVRYEAPSRFSGLLPFFRGLRRPFKPKIVRLLIAIAFWMVTFGWMVVCANLAAFRSPKNKAVLPDLLFDILPEHKLHPLPDILLYVLLTSVVGRIMFHSDGVAIARRFAAISGCIYFFRSFTLIATSFPNPRSLCQDYNPVWSLSGLVLETCADMTGHTVNLALAALCWSQYSKQIYVGAVAWAFASSGMVTLIVSRSHYTIDILFSVFISVFIWKYYHMALSLPADRRNRVVQWLEKLDFGAAAEDRGRELGDSLGPLGSLGSSLSSLGSPLGGHYKELEAGSPSSKFRSQDESSVPSFIELTASLGASDPSAYKELI